MIGYKDYLDILSASSPDILSCQRDILFAYVEYLISSFFYVIFIFSQKISLRNVFVGLFFLEIHWSVNSENHGAISLKFFSSIFLIDHFLALGHCLWKPWGLLSEIHWTVRSENHGALCFQRLRASADSTNVFFWNRRLQSCAGNGHITQRTITNWKLGNLLFSAVIFGTGWQSSTSTVSTFQSLGQSQSQVWLWLQ